MIDNLYQINDILDMIFSYGSFWVYAAIFLACFIENLFPPFPGDTFILAAGALVAVDRIDLIISFMTVLAGGLISVMIIYYLGKKKGYKFFKKKNYRIFSSDDIDKSELYFKKYGAVIIIFSRFVVGFRSGLALVAGIGQYNLIKMFIYSFVSYLLFGSLLYYISIITVENFDRLAYYIRTYNSIVWPLLILFFILYIIYKLRNTKRMNQ
jgi:membrane protein DedA with SNARE-associated domain